MRVRRYRILSSHAACARVLDTHTLQCGRETKCAHPVRAVGSGSRLCDVQRGWSGRGTGCHSLGGGGAPRVDAAASDSATSPSAKKKVCNAREHTAHLRHNYTQHTQALVRSLCIMCHRATRHKCAHELRTFSCTATAVFSAGSLVRRTLRLWPLRPAPVLSGCGALLSAAPSLWCAGLRRRDVLSH